MLVAITIIGLTVSLSVPAISAQLDSVRFQSEARRIVSDIQLLRTRALVDRRVIRLSFDDEELAEPIEWPEDFQVSGDDIVFFPSGICTGGVVYIQSRGGRRFEAHLEAGDCRVAA